MAMMVGATEPSHPVLSPKAKMAMKQGSRPAEDVVTVYVTIDPAATSWDTLAAQYGLRTAIVLGETLSPLCAVGAVLVVGAATVYNVWCARTGAE